MKWLGISQPLRFISKSIANMKLMVPDLADSDEYKSLITALLGVFKVDTSVVQTAYFTIKMIDEQSIVEVKLNRSKLMEAIRNQCIDFNNDEQCYEEYISKHLTLNIDGKSVHLTIQSQVHSDDFVYLKFEINKDLSSVNSIKMYNDVLIDDNTGQENIVHFTLYGEKRSFLLNKNRTQVGIKYLVV